MAANSKPLGKKLKNTAIYLAVRVFMVLIKVMGRRLSLLMARFLARVGFLTAAGERRKMEANLRLAFGDAFTDRDRRNIGKAVFSNIAQNLVDAVLLKRLFRRDPGKTVLMENLEIATRALARKKGIVFLTAHLGCFEILPPRFSLLGFPMIITGARIYDDRLNALIIENRRSYDVQYVQRDENIREILKGLKNGKAFGVLCDLNTRGETRNIPFFNRPAKTLSGPFKLAIKRGAAMIPTFSLRGRDGRQVVTLFPEIIPEGNTFEEKIIFSMGAFNRLLETVIRKDPGQWIWMHERWKS